MKKLLPVLLLFITPILNIPLAHADFCWETLPDGGANDLCGLASGNITKVFSGVNQPIETVQPGFSLVLLWGGILGIIWFKTERIDILGITGVMVAGSMVSGGAAGFLSSQATGIGFLLMFVSMGILLFQVIRQRITIFT